MSANIEGLLEQGKREARNGNRGEAQTYLMKVVELDQYNEEGWLWLSSVLDTEEEQRTCLENVMVINPENAQAQRALAELDRGGSSSDMFAAMGLDGKDSDSSDDFESFVETATAETDQSFAGNDDPFSPTSPFDTGGGAFSSSAGPFTTSADDDEVVGMTLESSLFADDDDDDEPEVPTTMTSGLMSPTQEAEPVENEVLESSIYADEDTAFYDDDLEESFEDDEPSEGSDLLAQIPDHIKPTRIPGTDETINPALSTGIIIVGVLNAAALIALVLQFML